MITTPVSTKVDTLSDFLMALSFVGWCISLLEEHRTDMGILMPMSNEHPRGPEMRVIWMHYRVQIGKKLGLKSESKPVYGRRRRWHYDEKAEADCMWHEHVTGSWGGYRK